MGTTTTIITSTTAPSPELPLINGVLSDEVLGRIFAFLAPENFAASVSHGMESPCFEGLKHVVLVCRRWKQILYLPQFWQNVLGICPVVETAAAAAAATTTTTTRSNNNSNSNPNSNGSMDRIARSILLASPTRTGNGLQFYGFRKIATQTPRLDKEKRFLVWEHATGRQMVISCVITGPDDSSLRQLMEQLQIYSRLKLQANLHEENDAYYKLGSCLGGDDDRLVFVRCLGERLAHHLDSPKFRASTMLCAPLRRWDNLHGPLPDIRPHWPLIVDWIFEVSLVFKLEIDTMFRAAQLVLNAYLRVLNISLFKAENAQLVAAAACYMFAQIDEKAARTISLTDLSHSMDNAWSAEDIWSCTKILLTLHSEKLGEPTILDFILLYFCYDDDPVESEVTRRTVTLAMMAACSTLVEAYPSRVVAACVCSLARFPLPHQVERNHGDSASGCSEVWSDALAQWTGLSWESLPMEEARLSIQQVLQTPNLLMSKFAHDLSSVAHLSFLPTVHDLEMYRRARKRARTKI